MPIKRVLIFVHRWLGVALCLFFLLWFLSGIGMMYWDFPRVTAADRLARSPTLDPSTVHVSPSDAFGVLSHQQLPTEVHLTTFDGRPAYRFRLEDGDRIVYADTGERQIAVPEAMAERIASVWVGQAAGGARVERIDVDQWTVQGMFRALRPMLKYSWPSGEQVYVSLVTGEVVQYTTTASRRGAYLGPIPHWLYLTPLRKHQPLWSRVVIWSSAIGTVVAIAGLVVGVWMYSPSRRYQRASATSSIPYRGPKRWHMIFGLIFGWSAATWVFSGMLSMDPFPMGRTIGPAVSGAAISRIPQALRGAFRLGAFTTGQLRDTLAQVEHLRIKELELTSFSDEPIYLALLGAGETRIITMTGDVRAEFDRQRIIQIVTEVARPTVLADVRVLDRYDAYYLDRHRERSLPVILARLNDADHTRYYVDPKTARVVGSYSSRNWVTRWMYHGLHSWDFPWLYNHRPAWDIVVMVFMLGGTAISVTSIMLAWRVVQRTLTRSLPADRMSADGLPSDELAIEIDR